MISTYSGLILIGIIGSAKNWVCIMVSEKLQKINNITMNQGNFSGNVMNIIGNDIELFEPLMMAFMVFVSPIFLPIALVLLYFYIGFAGYIGIVIIGLHFILVVQLNKITIKYRAQVVKCSDSRIKMITNMIEGMKIVKLYGWEHPYIDLISKQRKEEIKGILKLAWLQIFLRTIGFALDGLCVFVPVIIYIYMGNQLQVENAFSAMILLVSSSRQFTYILNLSFRSIFMFRASCGRISKVLLIKESESQIKEIEQEVKVRCKNLTLSWSNSTELKDEGEIQQFLLQSISFNMEPGEIMMVAGPVGCGKSSLLIGLLQQMHKISGKMTIKGSMTYAPEQPWIISDSVRQNVLMGLPFKRKRYEKALKAASLLKDIQRMAEGDQTLVGDKGVTLSGGQKTRICLARALYAQREILLLDDPLSAVDTQVSSVIFKQLKKQARKGKLVILVTHQIQYIHQVDKVLLIENGCQRFFGTYRELVMQKDLEYLIGKITAHRKMTEEEKESGDKKPKEEAKSGKAEKIEEEEQNQGSIPLSIYWNYIMLGFRNIPIFILFVIILIVSQFFTMMIFFWLGYWCDADDQQDDIYLYGAILIMVLLYILGFFRFGFLYKGFIRASRRVHNQALKGVTQTQSTFFDKNPSGRVINRFSKDTAIADEPLLMFLIDATNLGLYVFGSIILVIIISPANLVGLLIFCILFVVAMKKIVPLTKASRRIQLTSRSPLFTSINAVISGLVTIRALNLHQKFKKEVKEAAINNMKAAFTYQTFLRYMQLIVDLGAASLAAINIIVIISLKGIIDPQVAALTFALATQLTGLCSYWSKCLVETDNFMSSVQRLFQFNKLQKEGSYKLENKFLIRQGEIVFDRVCLRYQPHLPYSLKNLSFRIKAGHKVGVVGRTGAGKSTILQVLFRLINPTEGKIFIDNQDIMSAGLHQLRLQMSVIPQNPFIFKASVRDNVDPFLKHSDEEILQVLERINMKDFVEQINGNLNAQISSDEVSLSAGQKQMMCLARVVLRNNKIIMMDEATANIDHATDLFIQKQIKSLFKNSTVIIIAHRLRTIIRSDRVVVMEAGGCQEIGRPKTLASTKGSFFRKLIDHSTESEKKYLLKKLELIQ